MIYICADDYGLCDSVSMHIQQCIDDGALDNVSVFANINQVDLLDDENSYYTDIFDAICNALNFVIENNENVYSNYYSNYYEVVDGMGSFYKGSKLRPIDYNADATLGGKLEDNKYYVLSEDLTNKLNSQGENWVLNAQGNRVKTTGEAITTITNGSA